MFRFSPMAYVYQMGTVFALYFAYSFYPMLMNGFPQWQADLVSRADTVCQSKWVDNARNDQALKCYLSADIMRLCEKTERDHLAWLVSKYDQHQKNYEQALLAYTLRVQMNYNSSYQSEKDGMKAHEKAYTKAVQKAAEPINNPEFKKAVMLKTMLDKDVAELFRKVVKRGLLVRDDLSWSIPDYIERAFESKFGDKEIKLASCRAEV